MSLFVMTLQRYEILCHLREQSATVGDLMSAVGIPHKNNAFEQAMALRKAGLIEPRGSRARGSISGPRPILYTLTEKGEAAVQAVRVLMSMQERAYINLSSLEAA